MTPHVLSVFCCKIGLPSKIRPSVFLIITVMSFILFQICYLAKQGLEEKAEEDRQVSRVSVILWVGSLPRQVSERTQATMVMGKRELTIVTFAVNSSAIMTGYGDIVRFTRQRSLINVIFVEKASKKSVI